MTQPLLCLLVRHLPFPTPPPPLPRKTCVRVISYTFFCVLSFLLLLLLLSLSPPPPSEAFFILSLCHPDSYLINAHTPLMIPPLWGRLWHHPQNTVISHNLLPHPPPRPSLQSLACGWSIAHCCRIVAQQFNVVRGRGGVQEEGGWGEGKQGGGAVVLCILPVPVTRQPPCALHPHTHAPATPVVRHI